jgi:hypothetical protein
MTARDVELERDGLDADKRTVRRRAGEIASFEAA